MSKLIHPLFSDLILYGVGLICLLFVFALLLDAWQQKQQARRMRALVERSRTWPPRSTGASGTIGSGNTGTGKTTFTPFIIFRRKFIILLLASVIVVLLIRGKEKKGGPESVLPPARPSMREKLMSPGDQNRSNVLTLGANKTNLAALPNLSNFLVTNSVSGDLKAPIGEKPDPIGGLGIQYPPVR